MSHGIQNLIDRTRLLAGLAKARGFSDRQLLEQFADGDEAAFTAIVDRYGGLVMGVCRRVLQHTQDAEDAFQATFMVLAKKAGKIAWHDSVANWLHGVAYRVACQVRRETARLRTQDLGAHEPAVNGPDPAWSELKPVLDEELNRLPARYRIPLILCCLEGKSRDEAAAQLGWSVGSVKGRLERGREILRHRLTKRGLALSTALGATLLIGPGAQAAVPLTLGLETVRAGMAMLAGQTVGIVSTQVLTLTQGAIHAMFITKLKFAAAVLLAVGAMGLGTGYVTHRVLAGNNASLDRTQSYETIFAEEFPEYVTQREERKAEPTVSGIVQATDVTKNTINVLVTRGDEKGQTYDVVKDVKVVIREGRQATPAKFADVKAKASVVLTLDADKKIVQGIDILVAGQREPNPGGRERSVEGTVIHGILSEVDAGKKTVVLQSGGRGTDVKDTTYKLAKDAKVIFRTGRTVREGKLTDLELKKPVQLRLDDAKKLVKAIEVTISTTAGGTVSAIDATSITLESGGRGGDAKSEAYELGKDVKVSYRLPSTTQVRGATETLPLTIADVAVKTNITVQLDDARKVVQSIDISLITMRGAVQSVDAVKGTVLVRPLRGDDVDLAIAKSARVIVNGQAGKLDAVAVGADVHLTLSPDRSKVLVLQTPPPAGR